MPNGDNRPWPWIDLEAEFMTSSATEYPFILDFIKAKGIPEATARKHTSGWSEKRNLILQKAASKAITRYENNVAKMVAKQGNIVSVLIDVAFQELVETDSKGQPKIPLKFKKGSKITPAVVQRLLMQSMSVQQRLASAEGMGADRVADRAPFKTVAADGTIDVPRDESAKLTKIRKNPKLLAAAEKLIEGMGDTKAAEE
jgi:hypothetical protein